MDVSRRGMWQWSPARAKQKGPTMDFTAQQLAAIDNGQPVPLMVEGRPCVLVPDSLYEQLRQAIDDWQPKTMRRSMTKLMAEDWNDPAMSIYDE